jgi:uncharacterized membrane-anchored protein
MKRLAVGAVTIPLLALLGWCLALGIGLSQGTEVRLRIEGYDPRDLLSGRYIRYALSEGNSGGRCHLGAPPPNDTYCGCLTPELDSPYFTLAWIGVCDKKPADCTLFLKGSCRTGRFTAGIEEYYIPEELAPALQTIPPNSSIVLAVSRSGRSQAVQMLVEDVPVEEYARGKLAQ